MSNRPAVPGSPGRPVKGAAGRRVGFPSVRQRAFAEIARRARAGAVGGQGQHLLTVIGFAERGGPGGALSRGLPGVSLSPIHNWTI